MTIVFKSIVSVSRMLCHSLVFFALILLFYPENVHGVNLKKKKPAAEVLAQESIQMMVEPVRAGFSATSLPREIATEVDPEILSKEEACEKRRNKYMNEVFLTMMDPSSRVLSDDAKECFKLMVKSDKWLPKNIWGENNINSIGDLTDALTKNWKKIEAEDPKTEAIATPYVFYTALQAENADVMEITKPLLLKNVLFTVQAWIEEAYKDVKDADHYRKATIKRMEVTDKERKALKESMKVTDKERKALVKSIKAAENYRKGQEKAEIKAFEEQRKNKIQEALKALEVKRETEIQEALKPFEEKRKGIRRKAVDKLAEIKKELLGMVAKNILLSIAHGNCINYLYGTVPHVPQESPLSSEPSPLKYEPKEIKRTSLRTRNKGLI